MLIGYARVSTDDQSAALQIRALNEVGCVRVFCDQGVSGGESKRAALSATLRALRTGDTLIIWRLDRLGRSLPHLLRMVASLEKRRIGLRSLMEAIDTTTSCGKLLLHIIGALAEFERALISERTKAGLKAARAEGQRLGRPAKLEVAQVRWIHEQLASNTVGLKELAEQLHVSTSTVRRAITQATTL